MRNLIFVILTSGLLAACGFHLQGSRPLPASLQKLTIEYKQPYDVVKPALLGHLQAEAERRGGWVVDQHDESTGRLRILELEESRHALSINPETGKRNELLLRTEVSFDYLNNKNTLLTPQRLVVFREVFYDIREVVAGEYEVEETRSEMQRELAQLIFMRLEAGLASIPQ